MLRRRWWPLALLPLVLAEEASCSADEPTCGPQRSSRVTGAGSYYWPMGMGHPNYYSNPPWPGPTDLKKAFSWHWFGPNGSRYEESFVGAVIDDESCIYASGDHRVYKLSSEGSLIWTYVVPGHNAGDGAAIYDGRLHGLTQTGVVYAVNMSTGAELWVTQASNFSGGEYSQLAAHQGVVVVEGDKLCQELPFQACSCAKVQGLNASDGRVLWNFTADDVLWDWFPQFPDDETVIFMDKTGGLYRLRLQTGELIWKAPGTDLTWTDGSQFVAANGLTYTVQVSSATCHQPQRGHVNECEGYLTAYRTSDGSQVWRVKVPKPPNSSPVVGFTGGRPTLVMPIGQQSQRGCVPPAGYVWMAMEPLPDIVRGLAFMLLHWPSVALGDYNTLMWGRETRTHDVLAFDPATGERLWSWEGPTTHRPCNRGDEDGFMFRFLKQIRLTCCPTPWGQPRIDSAGTVYVANENGDFFALQDANMDGTISEDEVSVYHTGATFPHLGSAHAPGMVVAVNFDGVFVFKT